jgi:hypothetical protein
MRRSAIHLGLVFGFIFAIALSASPSLHERFHPDAKRAQHECAVTLLASGSYHHGAAPTVTIAPASVSQFGDLPALSPVWVASPFLNARIFEHAPPARA